MSATGLRQPWITPPRHVGIASGRCDDKIEFAWRNGRDTLAIAAMFPGASEADVANRLAVIRDAERAKRHSHATAVR